MATHRFVPYHHLMSSSRANALRRLGGPVCPACDTPGVEPSVHSFAPMLGPGVTDWLNKIGKGHLNREGMVVSCDACATKMHKHAVECRADDIEREERRRIKEEANEAANYGSLTSQWQGNSREYREAQDEFADDLEAAEAMASEWGLGNGLFGGHSKD